MCSCLSATEVSWGCLFLIKHWLKVIALLEARIGTIPQGPHQRAASTLGRSERLESKNSTELGFAALCIFFRWPGYFPGFPWAPSLGHVAAIRLWWRQILTIFFQRYETCTGVTFMTRVLKKDILVLIWCPGACPGALLSLFFFFLPSMSHSFPECMVLDLFSTK